MRPVDNTDLLSGFSEKVRSNNVFGLRVATGLGFTFVPAFGLLDYVLAPGDYQTLWIFRGVATIASLLIFLATFSNFGRKHVNPMSTIAVLIVSSSIAAMIRFLGGYESTYYAGLILLIIVAGVLFSWTFFQSALTNFLIVMLFLIPVAIFDRIENISVFVSNSFFLVTTGIVIVIGQAFNYRLKFREYLNSQLILQAKVDLEKAHEQLKQLDRFMGQVFANITHELKTPLNMILSPLELILDGDLGRITSQQKGTFQSMFRSGMKLLKLIMDILDLSKVQDSRIFLKVFERDLVEYLRGLVAQVELLAERKEIKLTFESNVESTLVWCDIERLERVFINLLSNAAKFTPLGGNIQMKLTDEGDTVLVQVVDDGPGFPSDQAERVFERFFQTDMGSARKFGGTGIGLSLALELVELHGGKIWAQSEEGEGATFSVRLIKDQEHFNPEILDRRAMKQDVVKGKREGDRGIMDWSSQLTARDEFRMLDIAEATDRRIVERDMDEDRREHKVLVVDDTPDIIRVVHLALHQHFKVLAAEDGLKGYDLATAESPDLIITDLMMPGIDGLELTTRLRDDKRTKHTPIIMLTARGDLDDRVAGIETGVNTYLTKPFSPRELVSCVHGLLDIKETTADLVLDQKMDSLEDFSSGMAHEIRNPLNYIKNAVAVIKGDTDKVVELLARTGDEEPAGDDKEQLDKLTTRIEKMFGTAEAGIKRITGTVELMSSYARQGFERTVRPHDMFAAVSDVVNVVLPATGRTVEITSEFDGPGRVNCVPEEFNQVLTNLIQNAIEAVPDETGRIVIRGWNQDGMVHLSVKDNGTGMNPETRERIFNPYFSTKGPGRGMGMGLTITHRVVRSLGGDIRVESTEGAGTEFIVSIPASEPDAETEQ